MRLSAIVNVCVMFKRYSPIEILAMSQTHPIPGTVSLTTSRSQVAMTTTVELKCNFQKNWKLIYWELDGALVHIQSSLTKWTKLSPKHEVKGKLLKRFNTL